MTQPARAAPPRTDARGTRVARSGALLAGCLAACAALAGCESQYRQDPLLVRGRTTTALFARAPIYVDRPLADNVSASIVFADYLVLLHDAGLDPVLGAPGPYTAFALINTAIEDIPAVYRDRMLAPANRPGLRRLMAYTIVPGRFTTATLLSMINRGGGSAVLRTLDGDPLTVRLDPRGGSLELVDPTGRVGRLVLVDAAQSNGMLYASDGLIAPN